MNDTEFITEDKLYPTDFTGRMPGVKNLVITALSLLCVVFVTFGCIGTFPVHLDADDGTATSTDGELLVIDPPFGTDDMFGAGAPLISIGQTSVSAESAFLCTAGGRVVYAKNHDVRLPMASITKIMTAIVVLENVDRLDKTVKVSAMAQGVEGSSVYLVAGDEITLEDLLYALMLASANDSAVALACEISGSVDAFVQLMNSKADELGMEDTQFKNPHGLSCDGHYTTACDFAKLMSYCLGDKTFCDIIGTRGYTIYVNGQPRTVSNHNRLLHSCDGMIGGKTGYTVASGRTLVTAAQREGVTLICVTLNASDDWNDHRRLYNLAFDIIEATEFSSNDISVGLHVVGGENTEEIQVVSAQNVKIIRTPGQEIEFIYNLPRFEYAPILKGDSLGSVLVKIDGVSVAELALISEIDVPISSESHDGNPAFRGVIERIRSFFQN